MSRLLLATGVLTLAACAGPDRAPVANTEQTGRPERPRPVFDAGPALDAAPRDGGDGGVTDAAVGPSEGETRDAGGIQSSPGEAGTGAPGPGEWNEPGAPIVELLSPEAQDEPDEVFHEVVPARCLVRDGQGADSKPFDPSTVVLELVGADGVVLVSEPGERAEEEGVFEADFPALGVAAGKISVRCLASDSSSVPKTGVAEVSTFVDHGPDVEIVTPEEFSAQSALGAVAFEFLLNPAPLVDDDPGARISEATVSILGKEFELVELEDEPGLYRTTIDFSDTELFSEVPTGTLQVAVEVTNERGVTRALRYTFVLDGTGPRLEIVAPLDTSIVGGTVALQVRATDDISHVNWDTLDVRLNEVSHPYDPNGPWRIDGDVATFVFESADVEGSVVQMNVNVLIDDEAGNASSGASALYYRDEQVPIVMLDPLDFRELDTARDPFECSEPFDALGDTPTHGSVVPDVAVYRALVWDMTNDAPGVEVLHPAYVNRESVDLFVRRADAPLVIDTNGDGTCDDIAEEGTRFQELTALTPVGAPLYTAEGQVDAFPQVTEDLCVPRGRTPPNYLCTEQASDLRTVIGHSVNRAEPLIYAVSPDNSYECTGRGWELPSAGLSDYQGWVCLAVRAFDYVGNRGVSKPLAVCLDNSQVAGVPACVGEEPPDCMDGCTAPPELSEPRYLLRR